MTNEVERQPKNTIKIKITVPASEISGIRHEVIMEMAKNAEISGFRKGMAPIEIVEKNLDESKVRGEVINHAVTKYYFQAIKEALLKPIVYPKLEIVQFEKEKDLIFEAKVCEKPEVKIGDYKGALKRLRETNPPKPKVYGADGQPTGGEDNKENELEKILDEVLKVSQVEISDILIDEEINHMLTRLVDQISRLGMTIEQYLESSKKTAEQLKEEYRSVSEHNLKLEFVLLEIAKDAGVSVSEEEISATIKAAPDDKSRQTLESEENKNYIAGVLLKNKVIQSLVGIFEGGNNEKTIIS